LRATRQRNFGRSTVGHSQAPCLRENTAGHLTTRAYDTSGRQAARASAPSRDIPALNVRLGWWWRLIDDADSGRRRLTLFPHVAPERLTCQRCVAAAFPRPPSVT
jgi:hypothetical protein